MALFTSFDGRISRRAFWLGFLVMAVVGVAIGLGLLAVLPAGMGLKIVQLIVLAAMCYIWAAVVVKRLHDRDKPAVPYAIVFLGPAILNSVMKVFLIGHTAVDIAGVEVAVPGLPALIVTYVSIAVSLWMIVELGFFKGTSGGNRYGPDPLAAANG